MRMRSVAPGGESEAVPVPDVSRSPMTPNLLDVTETAALACGRHLGRNDSRRAREVAAAAMLDALEELGVRGRVVLGPRGDEVLSHGTVVGPPDERQFDLAVYPVEGSALVSR